MSLYGNPEGCVNITDEYFSVNHLPSCKMYIDSARHINFGGRSIYCEIGAGLGRQIEVIAGINPKMTVLLFEIPPQLYVANQYLKKVFGERVIEYDDGIKLSPGNLQDIEGKIVILPTWKIPDWAETKIDIFWNSASFQEMEPDVVENYLSYVKSMNPEWIYINAVPWGKSWGEWKPGMGGSKLTVTEEVYFNALLSRYLLQTKYPTHYFLSKRKYQSYIFRRQG
ncbi:MAG TPA: putative sugar O-methyltransferase [Syntrophales bacterium]|nr:putative sugar O-methyltransferase [Syntrophales bacterium]